MDVQNAWYVGGMNNHIVVELPDLSLWTVPTSSANEITKANLKKYSGLEPSAYGKEVSSYELSRMGITRKSPARTKTGIVRLSNEEKYLLKKAAELDGLDQSGWMRQHIMPALRTINTSMEEKSQ